MRILSIRLRNLNSLRDAHELNLESGPLADAGLFAITGPTGAGKSTILDAVTLALYGRAARYGNNSAEDMMSRGTGECMAAVDFECRSGRFTARWTMRRSRDRADGKPQPPKHELSKDGVIIEEKRAVVRRIEELTGLDYDRFLRSVLLAQGQFAAFLNAGRDDRADLLERITGSEIYSELGKLAFRIRKQNDEDMERAAIRLGAIMLLSEDERAALGRRLEVLTEELAAGARAHTTLTDQVGCLKRAARLREQQAALAAETARHRAEVAGFAPDEARLQQHAAAQPFASLLRDAGEAARQAARAAETKSAAARRLEQDRGEAALAAGVALAVVAAGESAAALAQEKAGARLADLTAKTAAAREWLSARGVETGDDPAAAAGKLQEEVVRITQSMETLDRFSRTHTSLVQQQQELAVLVEEIRELTAAAAARAGEEQHARALLEAARREETLLHELVSRERLIRSLEEHRAHLQDGEPCPLCGATAHPYAAGTPEGDSAESRLKAQQANVRLAEQAAAQAVKASAAAQKAVAAASGRSQSLQETLSAGKHSLAAEWQRHSTVAWDASPSVAAALIADAKRQAGADHLRLTETLARARELCELERQAELCRHELKNAANDALTWSGRRGEMEEAIRQSGITPARAPESVAGVSKAGTILTQKLSGLSAAAALLATAETDAAKAEANAAAAAEALTAALAGSSFAGGADVNAALLDEATLTALTHRRDALRDTRTRLETMAGAQAQEQAEVLAQWAGLCPQDRDAAILPVETLGELTASLAALTARVNSLRTDSGALRQQLAGDDAARALHSAAAAALEELKLAAAPWARLAELIGSADGDKFSRFAQSITLDHLTALANVRLTQLCDRYQLARAGEPHELQLQISDSWQAGASRPMESLSGGETFLISLALALALSELAGHRTRIATLFIDEGFGTLDTAALDTALAALETLRAGHNTIGIISHVEALKARLTTQVEVTRAPGGWGRLEIKT